MTSDEIIAEMLIRDILLEVSNFQNFCTDFTVPKATVYLKCAKILCERMLSPQHTLRSSIPILIERHQRLYVEDM